MSSDRPWQRLTRTEQEQRIAAARVVSAQRRDPTLTLSAAAEREGLSPQLVLRYFGRWYRRDPAGQLQPLPRDDEPFLMTVFSTRGVVEVEAPDSDARSLIGRHTATAYRLAEGEPVDVSSFHGVRIGGTTLETDPDRLITMIWNGPDFLEIYST